MTLEGRRCRGPGHSLLAFILPPETGASKLGPDLIHNICTADSECQLGPTAGLVMSVHSLTP